MTNEKARELALDTISLIETNGWIQNTAIGSGGEVCLGQALYSAYRDGDYTTGDHYAVHSFLYSIISDGLLYQFGRSSSRAHHAIMMWNDEPGRSIEDVILLLKQAAESLGVFCEK